MIIGSVAARHHIPGWREPKDVDILTPMTREAAQEFYPSMRVETFWHPTFHPSIRGGLGVGTLDELYTIKVSHSYWDVGGSWDKHIEDAARLKTAGAQLLPDLHRVLYRVWEEKHGYKRLNLEQEADEFFRDAVRRKYDHDSIHRSVAYGERPMYEYALRVGAEVAMDMAKVKAWPFEQQLQLFREEIYATALERIVIPKNYRCSPGSAYRWALKRTVTSLTKGWSARFIVENYADFRKPDCDYVSRHLANKHVLIPIGE